MTGKQRRRQKLQRRKARTDNQMFACISCDKWLERHWHLAVGMSEQLAEPICTACARKVDNLTKRVSMAGKPCGLCHGTGIMGDYCPNCGKAPREDLTEATV